MKKNIQHLEGVGYLRYTTMKLKITRIRKDNDLPLPSYQTSGAAGMDLCAAEHVTLEPFVPKIVPTGFAIEVPVGFEAQLRMRSGIALKKAVILPNAPATIDSDYRGEVGVIMMATRERVEITRGERIAQMVIAKVERCEWEEVKELSSTARGGGGFGHTGTSSIKN